MHFNKIISSEPVSLSVVTAKSTSSLDAMPVETITGFFVAETFFNRGMSLISGEAILNAQTSRFCRKSTAVRSNGLEKYSRPIFFASLNSASCHSHGV